VSVKNGLFKRLISLIIILIIVSLFGGVIYCMITGSEHLFAMVIVAMIVPVIIYLLLWVKKVFSKSDERGLNIDGESGKEE
jgi:hypothetical protein